MKLTLPKPEQDGHYKMADGSVIYRSSVHKGFFMLWVWTVTKEESGVKYAEGEFVLTKNGVAYFASPVEALQYLREIRK